MFSWEFIVCSLCALNFKDTLLMQEQKESVVCFFLMTILIPFNPKMNMNY